MLCFDISKRSGEKENRVKYADNEKKKKPSKDFLLFQMLLLFMFIRFHPPNLIALHECIWEENSEKSRYKV